MNLDKIAMVIGTVERLWINKKLMEFTGCNQMCDSCKKKLEGVSLKEEFAENDRTITVMVGRIPFAQFKTHFDGMAFSFEEVRLERSN